MVPVHIRRSVAMAGLSHLRPMPPIWFANDTNSRRDIFVSDRVTGVVERVSVASDGTQANASSGGFEMAGEISADGRYVAFESAASNLVPLDANDADDIFVYDRMTNTIERVSIADDGSEADGDSAFPSISADGQAIAFESKATNLVVGDSNSSVDVFVRDRGSSTTERVSIGDDESQADSSSDEPSISADGRFVAFRSYDGGLVPGNSNSGTDTYVRDRAGGTTERVGVPSDGSVGDGRNSRPMLSASGDLVVLSSWASNLVAGDTNDEQDIFVYDRTSGLSEMAFEMTVTSSVVAVTQVTTAHTTGARHSVQGRLTLWDVLFAVEALSPDYSQAQTISSWHLTPGFAPDVGPLRHVGYGTPTHAIFTGTLAIDAGDASLAGTVDQRGEVRLVPDYGAYEATTATLQGRVVIATGEDRYYATGEIGVPNIEVRAIPTAPSG